MMRPLITKTLRFSLLFFAFSLTTSNLLIAGGPVDGGVLSIEGGAISIDICAGDNTSDAFNVTLTDTMAETSNWVITDPAGTILGLPAAPPFDLEGAGAGQCLIWHLSSSGPLEGLNVNANVANLTGCFDFSNEITVNREGVDGGGITFADGSFSLEICSGDGVADPIMVVANGAQVGTDFIWTITDSERNILALPGAPPFDLEPAGPGTCLIIGVAYNSVPDGLEVGSNLDDLVGCHGLSNPISVKRNGVNGGMLTTTAGETELNICGNDGISDAFNVTLTDNTGEFGDWVITDSDGLILAIPATPPFDVEGAGPGTCQVWFVAYFDQLVGLLVGNNVSQIQGCYDFSNPITVNRDGPDGGSIAIANGGGTAIDICAGDGNADPVDVDLDWIPGGTSVWIITDNNQNILDIPNSPPFDFEGAGAGICQIWHISHCPNLAGLTVGNNVSDLTGDYQISNSITVNRTGVAGGMLATTTGAVTVDICAGDGISDAFDVVLTGNVGTNSAWVITDTEGNILGLPTAPPFDLEGAGAGTCLIWHLSYEDGLIGLTMGNNVDDIEGCYVFSNEITVEREDPEGGDLTIPGGTATEIDICAGDGISDAFSPTLTGAAGSNMAWVITDADSNILALPAAPPFDLEGAGGGLCLIWHLSYGDGLTGLTVDANTQDLEGCYDLSNPIRVVREGVDGGSLTTDNMETEISTCANDGVSDAFNVNLDGNTGENGAWVITNADGDILGLPMGPPFDLEGAGQGVCQVWYLAYANGLTGLAVNNNVADLDGCYAFSNPITVTREAPIGGDLSLTGGATTIDICAGDGVSDAFTPELINNAGSSSAWIITDANGTILGLPDAPPFDLEGAGGGQCLIWHLSYGGIISGLEVGVNTNNITGCISLSNAITVNRSGVNGGEIATTDGATELSICAGDGISDAFNVVLTGNNVDADNAWVITDLNGLILGLPPSPPFDLDLAGAGTCLIWNLNSTNLSGLVANANVDDLTGCYDFSNPITVVREDPAGGQLRLADGTTELSICAGDGVSDAFTPIVQNNLGTSSAWIITDPNGTILGLPAAPPFDLEGAGGGQCLIWHLSYGGSIDGLEEGANANDLVGCWELSNPITVNRTGVDGGELATSTGATEISICAGDGVPDPFDVTLTGTAGANTAWVITNTSGDILGLPMNPPFDLDGAGVGTCQIWNLSYEDGLTGLAVDNNVSMLEGCFALSNPITVIRSFAVGGILAIEGGGTAMTICAGDGAPDPFNVELVGNEGTNSGWVITDDLANILALPAAPPFDLEGAGGGVCLVWHISYADGVTGIDVGANAMDIVGCYDLSNPITVTRNGVAGGALATTDGATELNICAGDGIPDPFGVTLADNVGDNSDWVITDNDGNILALPAAPPFDLEGAGGGVCFLWNISYANGITGFAIGENVMNIEGCFALSNSIQVNRTANDNTGGDLEITGGGNEIDICAGDGIPDPIEVTLINNAGDNSGWIITDANGTILGLPDAPPFDLEGAGPGQCLIWHISYSDGLTGLAVDNVVADLDGCYQLSDAITVNRNEATPGELAIAGGATEITICAGDGTPDPIEVDFSGGTGDNQGWVITDAESNILGVPAAPPFDLEGAGAGVCFLWAINYADGLTGLEVDGTIPNLEGCYALSNAITVTRVTEGDLCTTGTKDLLDNDAFMITPNPTTDLINITISRAFNGKVNLRLVDVAGKVLYTEKTNAQTIPMNLDQWSDGVYFLEITHEEFIGIQKVIKQ